MKKLISIFLSFALMFCASACTNSDSKVEDDNDDGAVKEKSSDAETVENKDSEKNSNTSDSADGPGNSYASAYSFYTEMTQELSTLVMDIVDNHNAKLEEENPDGYFYDPSYYLMLAYMPFSSLNMAFTATVDETTDSSAIEMAYSFLGFKDVKFIRTGKGEYTITSSYENSDGTVTSYEEYMKFSDGSLSYNHFTNGEQTEYLEFVNLGNNRYAVQNESARALITYKNGEITSLVHSSNKYETDWETGALTDWSVVNEYPTESIWGRDDLDEDWVLEKGEDAYIKIYSLTSDTLTITGLDKNTDWSTGEISFVPMSPIVITYNS